MTTKRNRIMLIVATLALVILALPVMASAQGRGRGLGRGNNRDWKCSIFVNCHDARDGRLDGRGPRASRIGLRNRVFVNRGRRERVRRFRDDDRFRETRGNSNFGRDRFMRRDEVRPSDRVFRNQDVFRARGRGRGRP